MITLVVGAVWGVFAPLQRPLLVTLQQAELVHVSVVVPLGVSGHVTVYDRHVLLHWALVRVATTRGATGVGARDAGLVVVWKQLM